MKARKSLGQNFLRDPKILRKIADFAHVENGDTILEIGPGEGTLTKVILERAKKVIVVEKDERLVEELKEKFKIEIVESRLEIVEGDVLDYKPPSINYKLVGNIPYYITGEIFRKFLESANSPKSLTFVIQKEVANRIMARDGKESVLSISIKAFGTPEYGGIIKAGSFSPQPKVDSAIISVRNISWKNTLDDRVELFFQLVKKGFSHKRKLLMKNLGATKEIFEQCNIPEKSRAEDLSLDDWTCLAKSLI